MANVKPGLLAINHSTGASGVTELHALMGHESFSRFCLHAATGLHTTGPEWFFTIADLDRDYQSDLVAINRQGASGKTEVHVLSGISGFKDFSLHAATGLHPTGSEWDFAVVDWNGDGHLDLVAINRNGGSDKTEVHVLSGASGFQDFIAHISTGLHTTNADWSFFVVDWTRTGHRDLAAVNRNGGSGKTEIHVLSGASGLQDFIVHSATGLDTTNADWSFGFVDWDGDGSLDLAAINRNGASGTTEVHILSAASGFQSFVEHIASELHHTGEEWTLLMPEEFVHLRTDEINSGPPSFLSDLQFFSSPSSGSSATYLGMHLNAREQVFVREHPIDAARGYLAAREAMSRAAHEFPESVVDGRGDAVRHCYYSATLHRDLEEGTADTILDNHEFGRNDPHDAHNNSVGNDVCTEAGSGASNDGLWDRCKEAADTGRLTFDE